MKPTQQEIIELAREAGMDVTADESLWWAVHQDELERLVHLALERFGAGGGEPVAAAVFDEHLGRPALIKGAPLLNHGQVLYTYPSSVDLRAEYLRGLEDAAKVCDERAQGLLSIIDLPVVSSQIIQKDRAAQWKDAATKIRELKGKQ